MAIPQARDRRSSPGHEIFACREEVEGLCYSAAGPQPKRGMGILPMQRMFTLEAK